MTDNVSVDIKPDDLPATRGMLKQVRNELKSDIRGLEQRIDLRFKDMESRFGGLESRFSGLESKLSGMESTLANIHLLVEEQRADNRIVLEALTGLAKRQDRVEERMDSLETSMRTLAAAKSSGLPQ